MSRRGICSSHVTSCAKIKFQQLRCRHPSGPAPGALLSGFIAAQGCRERQSRRFRKTKKPREQSCFTHELIFSEEQKNLLNLRRKLQTVKFRSLPSRAALSCPRLKRRRESAGRLRWDHPFSFCYAEVRADPARTDDLSLH